jgi:glucokinase
MKKKYILAIDLGGTNLKIGLLDLKYRIIHKQVLCTRKNPTKEQLIAAICESIKNIIQNQKLNKASILGVGLGLPGPIDVEKGLVHYFPNIPGWKEVKLRSILEKRLKLPVVLDNDAKVMALAEFRLGAARGSRNAVCLTLGTGVGSGIIINATLYRAKTFAAGEIGHIPINEAGPRCNCGGIACMEAYVGNERIKAAARRLFRRDISLEELSALARKGNKKAIDLWSQVGKRLGIGLVGVVNFLSPDCIVIGGGVAKAGRVLFNKVKEVILKRAMPVQARHVKILKAKLGSDAGLIGAAILAKEGI